MAKILGLDLGTNSIGWAVVDSNKLNSSDFFEKEESIIACGSRIFKEGVNLNSAGKEESKNLQRRTARGARRRNNRFKKRRTKLIRELSNLGMLPDDKHYTFNRNESKDHTIELFNLRKDAIEKQIRLEDIGRIFLQINNHRGFKSNKTEDAVVKADSEKQKELKGVKGRISKLEQRINECNCRTIGEYYYYLIEQNKNSHNPNEPKLLNTDDIFRGEGAYTSRDLFSKEFDEIWSFQTQYYPEVLTDENKLILKDESIFYQRELKSAKHLRNRCKLEYKGFRWDKNGKKQLNYLPCCPKSAFEFQEYRIWEQLNKIRYTNYEVTHQPLDKKQKEEIAKELHFAEKLGLTDIKKIVGLHPHTKFNDFGKELKGNITQARLKEVLKDKWFEFALNNNGANEDNFDEKFEPLKYSETQKMLWHNIEFAKDKEWLLGDNDFLKNKQNSNLRRAKKNNRQYQPKNNWRDRLKILGLTKKQVQQYSELTFEPGYSDLSLKAIKKMLPYMKQGDDPVTASFKVYGDYSSTIQKQDIKLEHLIPQLENNALKNPIVEKSVRETIKVINAIIAEYGKPDEIHLEMARELKMPKEHRENRRRRNDEKDQAREEYAKFLSKTLHRNIDKTSPEIKKFEMFLQLNYSDIGFQSKIKGQITGKEIEDFFSLKIPSDKTKYYLWLECDRKDPYEGKTISLQMLFTPEVEIEHIIPYSICGDDSFLNKTLSFKKFNAKKGDKTPVQFFNDKPNEKRIFEQSIKHFPPAKQERFLMTDDKLEQFKNSQLNNTAYIATEVRKHLLKSYENDKIELTNGSMTSVVRTLLGFNSILINPQRVHQAYNGMGKVWAVLNDDNEIEDYIERKNEESPKGLKVLKGVISYDTFYPSKSRNDHRHHAIDALITAILSKKINNSILKSTEGTWDKITGEFKSKFYENDKGEYRLTREAIEEIKTKLIEELTLDNLDELLPIAKRKIESILVSYENKKLTSFPRKKLFAPNGRPLKDKYGKHLRSGGISVRQDLHEKFYYGKTNKEGMFVRRIKISELTFKQLVNIVDDTIRELIISKIADYVVTVLEDTLNPVRLIDNSYYYKGKIVELIKLRISEDDIKEKLDEINEDDSPEAKTQKKSLRQLEAELKNNLPVKEDYAKLKKAIEKGLKAAIKDGIYLKNDGIRQKKKGTFNPDQSRNDIPIRKVRVKFKSSTAVPLKRNAITAELTPNTTKNISQENYQYIMPGSNYMFVIYGDPEGKYRDKHIVSWFDKAQIDIENQKIKSRYKKEGIKGELKSYYPKKILPVLCELFHNDMVVVYKESPNEINWYNPNELFNRLFTVVKFTLEKITLIRHNVSKIPDKPQPIKLDYLLDGEGFIYRPNANTFKGIKVKIDPLGNITRV